MARKSPNERDKAIYSTPILSNDTGSRLDAIVRRHGGKPKSTPPGRMVLPPVGRRECKDQIDMFDELADE